MISSLTSCITANFSFANYTEERRRELVKLFSRTAFAMMLVGVPLLAVDIYFTALLSMSGFMLAVLAGGVDVSDRILTRKKRRAPCRFQAAKVYISQTCARAHAYSRNRARSHRSASRSTFSKSSKDNSDSGESDAGDPPGPLPSVIPPLCSSKKSSPHRFPWRSPGSWRMVSRKAGRGRFA